MIHFPNKMTLPDHSIVIGRGEGLIKTHGEVKGFRRQRFFPRPGTQPIGTFGPRRYAVYSLSDCATAKSTSAWLKERRAVRSWEAPLAFWTNKMGGDGGRMVRYGVYCEWQTEPAFGATRRKETEL